MANDKRNLKNELEAIQQKLNAKKPKISMDELAEAIDVLLRHALNERPSDEESGG